MAILGEKIGGFCERFVTFYFFVLEKIAKLLPLLRYSKKVFSTFFISKKAKTYRFCISKTHIVVKPFLVFLGAKA